MLAARRTAAVASGGSGRRSAARSAAAGKATSASWRDQIRAGVRRRDEMTAANGAAACRFAGRVDCASAAASVFAPHKTQLGHTREREGHLARAGGGSMGLRFSLSPVVWAFFWAEGKEKLRAFSLLVGPAG